MFRAKSLHLEYNQTIQLYFPDIELNNGEDLLILGKSGINIGKLSGVSFLLDLLTSRISLLSISILMKSHNFKWIWVSEEWWLLVATTGIGLSALFRPAIQIFKLNISKTLTHA